MIFIGIDNGVTGSIGIIEKDGSVQYYSIPTKTEQSYTKTKQNITRLDVEEFKAIIGFYFFSDIKDIKVFIERPMVNPGRFKATLSAMRCLEAVLICIEDFQYSYQYIDSKEWQKAMLPSGLKGGKQLKKASLDIGCRLFPQCKEEIIKQKDADGLLIAEYARRQYDK